MCARLEGAYVYIEIYTFSTYGKEREREREWSIGYGEKKALLMTISRLFGDDGISPVWQEGKTFVE